MIYKLLRYAIAILFGSIGYVGAYGGCGIVF